jgi:hypothetical protein
MLSVVISLREMNFLSRSERSTLPSSKLHYYLTLATNDR